MERRIKQVLLVRKDLDMPVGKIGAQCAHASRQSILEIGLIGNDVFKEWQETDYTTICLGVKNLNELEKMYNKAKEAGLPVYVQVDSGYTCFDGEKTKTVLAIGPALNEEIDAITKRLRLL